MPLSATKAQAAKPQAKQYKLSDAGGLYLLVKPDGSKYWRLKYRFGGKEKLLAIGVYDAVSLAEARVRRDDAKRELRDGKDPGAEKQARKRAAKAAAFNTFRAVAEEWLKKTSNRWKPTHTEQVRASLENNLFPAIGHRAVSEITAAELKAVLGKIEARGAHEARARVQQRASSIFRYAIANGVALNDPAHALRGAFTAPAVNHHASLAAKDLPEFFKKLEAYDGEPTTKLAIRLLALTFVRTAELRGAEWSEVDLKAAEWRIPAERMKMRDPHIVPLSSQAISVLRELQTLTGSNRYLLPGRTSTKPISENTILYALYRMGYHSRATGHGFRSTASTILNETGFAPDVIERQLAHSERNKVRAAYNRAQYLPERRKMMQHWADLLDGLAATPRTLVAGNFGRAA